MNRFGLGKIAGEFDLFCNEEGSGLASLTKRQLDHHGIDSRTFFRDFSHFFRAHGMGSTFRILPAGDLQPIQGYTEALEQFRTTNFLVLRD
ncbi:hypothetical protein OJ996_23745 [Luteolibacter sp. GHJ8]|uniref:Uncharacterized protein n=1 Tax=Luteolibacter rhizosphaerae TaxID=2989719 RepID=A0ABT3GAT7_9BACT|nr:hypothetical protein [Luteolibacter rhizosphaerae]MCW1916621.1 hypothetical protein [Luteolibacter rhizosphaerae]